MLKDPKLDYERWGSDSNNRHGRYRRKQRQGFKTREVADFIYLESIADNRALKITQALIDEAKTRWLINPVPQQFNVMGMVYHSDQIRSTEKTRYMYLGNGTAITILCVNPKRGVWKVYLKQA